MPIDQLYPATSFSDMTGPATKSSVAQTIVPCSLAPMRRHRNALACCMLLCLVSFQIGRVSVDLATVSRNEAAAAIGGRETRAVASAKLRAGEHEISVDVATVPRNETAAAVGEGGTMAVASAKLHASGSEISVDVATLSRNETAAAIGRGETRAVASARLRTGGDEDASCRRTCPHYDNRIVIRSKQKAGLKDRTYIMRAWANMAAFLCARARVPRPSTWLAEKHGRVVANVTFGRDLLYFADSGDPAEVVASDLIDSEDPRGGGPWGLDLVTELRSRRSKHQGHLVQDLFRVYNYTVRQRREGLPPFRWTVKGTFMHYSMKVFRAIAQLQSDLVADAGAAPISVLPEQLPKWERYKDSVGCVYASKIEAVGVQATARRALWGLRNRLGVGGDGPFVFGYLHVRRGDSKKDTPDQKSNEKCYTELPKMKEYLECTFRAFCREGAAEHPHCRRDVPLLIGSDEEDQGYREDLLSLINELDRPLIAVDLDKLVSNEIEREISAGESPPRKRNNYSVFLAGNVIIQDASFYLRQQRGWCNDCDADHVRIGWREDRWWSSWLAVDLHTHSCWSARNRKHHAAAADGEEACDAPT